MSSPPIRASICAGAVTGLVAGVAAGLIDGLWSWSAAAQFLPQAAGKLRLLLYLAAAYGLVGLAAGIAAAAVAAFFLRATRAGDLVRAAAEAHARARAQGPRHAVAGLAIVIAGVPGAAIALLVGGELAHAALDGRRHYGLVVGFAIAAALAALVVAAAFALAAGALIERGLARLAAHPRLGGPLSSPRAPARAALWLGIVAGAVAVHRYADTLRLLPLRAPTIALVALALALGFAPAGRRLAAPLAARRRAALAAVGAAALIVLVALAIVAGDRLAVTKAAVAYSGLGGPIARAVRPLGDLDRDGYSRFLGGGDCDDGDRWVHPGAAEIPDDGVDQNCEGGDLALADAAPPRSTADLGFTAAPAGLPADFNVLLITIDTLRADHLGAYGYPRDTSPVLDRLADEGALFLNGWAHAPSTRYSMPAILTGRLPLDVRYDHSVQGWPGLATEATTIAELLQPRGFHTTAIVNHWYFDKQRRMDQGFDRYDNENRRLHPGVPGKGPAETRGSSSREQTDKAIEAVAGAAGRRFFLWVHYYDPHFAYEQHAGVPEFGDAPIDRYDHEIRWTDQQLGRLFDDLRARGLWDRTVVVVTGDHGEGFGEKGIEMHGYHLYSPQTKVPFLIRVPGAPPRRVTTPVGHVDLMPTLANLAGAPASLEMMGRSLVDLIGGAADGEADRTVWQQLSFENRNEQRAAVTRACHVIYNVSPVTSWEIYRIDRDPGETRDVVDDPGPCAEVRAALARWHDAAQIAPDSAAALLPAPPTIERPLAIDFGDEVRLLAVEAPARARPGEPFDVTWTFEARGRLEPGWQVFAHFEGPGKTFQGDHTPARPFEWWRRGQHIRYTRRVDVPASQRPGTYRLRAGVWKGGRRRPVRGAGGLDVARDGVVVATIEVAR